MKINLVIEHDFAETPEAASFLEAIAAAISKVQRAAKFADGYHATNPLIKAAPAETVTEAALETAGVDVVPETAEAKEKRKRRTKEEMAAARAAEAAAAGNGGSATATTASLSASPVASAPSAPAHAPATPATGQTSTPAIDVPTTDEVREMVQRVLAAKGQPAAAACLAPHKRMSEVPPNDRAAVLAKCKAALAG